LIDPNIKSYHLFRKTRTQRVYRLLKEYRNRRILSILFVKLLLGKKVKLIVDGTILEVANLNRARTQRIKRFSGKAFWGKKKRNLYSEHYKERGCEYVEVCESKEQKGIRQVVEGVNSQIKLFNRVSRWRKGITLLAYLYGYAIGYSFFRKSQIWG
jgi:hypothetical protein